MIYIIIYLLIFFIFLGIMLKKASFGYEDEKGFHFGKDREE